MPRSLPVRSTIGLALTVVGAVQVLAGPEPAWEVAAVAPGAWVCAEPPRRLLLPAVALAASVGVQSASAGPTPAFASFLAMLVVAYELGRHADRPRVAVGLAVLAAGIALMMVQDPTLRTPAEVAVPAIYLSGAVAVGRTVAGRHRAGLAAVAAEREAASVREREALRDQRAAIAREMHDVVAHSLSLVVVQAEAAAAVAGHDPARSLALLDEVADTGRQALQEMRRTLGVLRAPEQDPRGPQPDLTSLPALADGLRRSGTVLDLDVDAAAESLRDPGAQLAAYRVVQEAVTNAVRHGRCSRVSVHVTRTAAGLRVVVEDDGTGTSDGAPGHGLVGMRERVQAYGGQLSAGPRAPRGWRVEATLMTAATRDPELTT